MSPREIENKLSELMTTHTTTTDPHERDLAWRQFQDLHRQRAPETVRLMEREQGLVR